MILNKENSEKFEEFLKERGYKKYVQNYKNEDYLYWKSFKRTEEKKDGYSVGFSFYDFSKYPQYKEENPIHVSYEFRLGKNELVDRIDLTVKDDRITVEGFEDFCEKFYQFYKSNNLK